MISHMTEEEHWWHRLADDVKHWLRAHPGAPLDNVHVLDAVIGAGGVPRGHEPEGDRLPDAPLLSERDWEYIKEQRDAGR